MDGVDPNARRLSVAPTPRTDTSCSYFDLPYKSVQTAREFDAPYAHIADQMDVPTERVKEAMSLLREEQVGYPVTGCVLDVSRRFGFSVPRALERSYLQPKEADPELQPRVKKARTRLEALRAKTAAE